MTASNASLAMFIAIGVMMLGTLYVAVVASGRAQPARIALRMTLHTGVLIAVAQALGPMLPIVFGMQMFVLFKRSLRQ